MGLFNRVIARCRDCDGEIEWQSKCGEYGLNTYDIDNVPVEIAKDIAGETETCPGCEKQYTIKVSPRDISNVRMDIE